MVGVDLQSTPLNRGSVIRFKYLRKQNRYQLFIA